MIFLMQYAQIFESSMLIITHFGLRIDDNASPPKSGRSHALSEQYQRTHQHSVFTNLSLIDFGVGVCFAIHC